MSDSLIPYSGEMPETIEESISRQFYDWEHRGRGWPVYQHPVDLEPPFRPFSFFLPNERPALLDDGKVPTFFSGLFDGRARAPSENFEAKELARYQRYCEYIEETDEPDYCSYYGEPFFEISVLATSDFKASVSAVRHMILSLAHLSCPVAFEIIGNRKQITIQFAATGQDLDQSVQQLEVYLPACRLKISPDPNESFLSTEWINAGDSYVIVDFGLSKEFALSLQSVQSLDPDPLATVLGAMASLAENEVAVFQILFQRCRNDWASEFIDTIRCFEDTEFFDHLPDIKHQARQKFSSLLYSSVVRIAAKTDTRDRSMQIVRNVGSALPRLANPSGNELIPLTSDGYEMQHHEHALLDRQSFRCGMLLNADELISLVHIPSSLIISAKLLRDDQRTKPLPDIAKGHALELGDNIHSGCAVQASVSYDQRTRHMHLIGSSGSGKSSLLLHLIKQDLENNQGLCVLDPHGDLIDDVVSHLPSHRLNDTILFDPSDVEFPIGFNILQANSELEKNLLSSDLVATFRRMSTSWGDVMDSVLANAILAFLESSNSGTLIELRRFLVEKDFRTKFLETVSDESIRYFWNYEFPNLTSKPQSSILIRLDAFLRNKLIRNIVCQEETKLDFRQIMDGRKVLLIKLSQGLIGEENAHLLGTLLVSKLYQTALSRQDSSDRPYYWIYLDEFQHFITPSMENILSGVRKFNIGLHLSHQEYRQMQSRSQDVASSVLSNSYTRICFRLGDADSEKFASGFSFFDARALQNLGVGEAVARVERAEYDFNLKTLYLPKVDAETAAARRTAIVEYTRNNFARPKKEVEETMRFFSTPVSEIVPLTAEARASSLKANEVPEQNPPHSSTEPKQKKVSIGAARTQSPQGAEPVSTKSHPQHRYLQSLIKRVGESHGFKATVEKDILAGAGRIDVVLEKDAFKIACEISITNEPTYEVGNIQKCLAAHFMPVLMISTDESHLRRIRKLAEETLPSNDLEKIQFLTPDQACLWIDRAGSEENSLERVKGFKVKVDLTNAEDAGQKAKKRAISDVIFGAFRRLKNKPDNE